MLNQIEGDDIIMKDCTNSNYSTFINFIRPRKRSYMEMINNSGQCHLNNRIYNYKVSDHMDKVKTSFNNNININKKISMVKNIQNDENKYSGNKENINNYEYEENNESNDISNTEEFYEKEINENKKLKIK